MRSLVEEISVGSSPEAVVESLHGQPGVVLLRSGLFDSPQARYSFVAASPFLVFRSFGSRCELSIPREGNLQTRSAKRFQFGDPWRLMDSLVASYELLDDLDLPFPLGGCFGYWGYDLKNFVEPKLPRRAANDLELPDCHVGFYDSLLVFDHRLGKQWIISTGLGLDGSRNLEMANARLAFWQKAVAASRRRAPIIENEDAGGSRQDENCVSCISNILPGDFISKVARAREYIRNGDIYQVNLSQRLSANCSLSGWELFQALSAVSPAPFSAFLDCGEFQIASSSPELFLRLSGSTVQTRPIKGTRPRSPEPTRDAQLAYELQTSPKEMAELVMITDLLRNDLGKVCDFGSVQVPELVRLERFPHVQHLVSTVEGRLLPGMAHLPAFASCFPGGSITGAPKFRAMEIIDELEPHSRGPYTGSLGYIGFNRESQLSIIIRAAIYKGGKVFFPVGAGIVADSNPEAEYEETLAKARGFIEALQLGTPADRRHKHASLS